MHFSQTPSSKSSMRLSQGSHWSFHRSKNAIQTFKRLKVNVTLQGTYVLSFGFTHSMYIGYEFNMPPSVRHFFSIEPPHWTSLIGASS